MLMPRGSRIVSWSRTISSAVSVSTMFMMLVMPMTLAMSMPMSMFVVVVLVAVVVRMMSRVVLLMVGVIVSWSRGFVVHGWLVVDW